MRINLAKSAGFCFGVRRAINIAIRTAAEKKNACMLGDIVHNEDVVRDIHRSGIQKIRRLDEGKGRALILRAHGASLDTVKRAERLGYKIIDATCPMVKEIHRIAANMEKSGRKIIIIGDKRHDEVRGIAGQLEGKAIVIDAIKNIPFRALKKTKKACVVVQSTQNIDKVFKIVRALKRTVPDLKFFNTVCRPTRLKQKEIKSMPLKNEIMLIVGSKTSANTKRLYEISKSINKNSYWIRSKEGLKRSWFPGIKSVGITGGASTPDKTIKEVICRLRTIAKARGY
ncbi:MAG: 4-hydroxy-3-methylbut-2-enyl diphosphate reductase [Candidatus Omnitrophota bacterium]|jgi:4-hydroxy-3-methylbut-2-enyl diphosphate reductase